MASQSSKAPPFEALNFKKFKIFFISFLMRHKRAHLVLTKDNKPRHIHDLDPSIPDTAPMTEAQAKQLRKARQIWGTRNETAYSFLMDVCNARPKASTTAALDEGKIAKGLMRALEERFLNAIESDRRGLVEGINLDKMYFRKKYQRAICKCNTCLRSTLTRKNFRTPRHGNPRERGVVSVDTMEVPNTPSMEGYK